MSTVPKNVKYLMMYIAGDIITSENPGKGLRKWREIFNVQQNELSRKIKIPPPVISNYEQGRRLPGIKAIDKIVKGLIDIDRERGYPVSSKIFGFMFESDAILDMKDFTTPVSVKKFVEAVEGEILYGKHLTERPVFGYTVIDSIKAILSMSGYEFFRLMGLTTARAAIFTNVSKGRSPMIAVRVYPIKPMVVIIHGPKKINDQLPIKIAEIEQIPLILSKIDTVEKLLTALRRIHE